MNLIDTILKKLSEDTLFMKGLHGNSIEIARPLVESFLKKMENENFNLEETISLKKLGKAKIILLEASLEGTFIEKMCELGGAGAYSSMARTAIEKTIEGFRDVFNDLDSFLKENKITEEFFLHKLRMESHMRKRFHSQELTIKEILEEDPGILFRNE